MSTNVPPTYIAAAITVFSIAAIAIIISLGGVPFMKSDPLTQARASCEVAVSVRPLPGAAKTLTPEQSCACIFEEIIPRFDQGSRDYLLDLYKRVEFKAPENRAQRSEYDADFGTRFWAAYQGEQVAHLDKSLAISGQLQALGPVDLGPVCNALKH